MSCNRPADVDQEVVVMELPPQVERPEPDEGPCPAVDGLDWRVDCASTARRR